MGEERAEENGGSAENTSAIQSVISLKLITSFSALI